MFSSALLLGACDEHLPLRVGTNLWPGYTPLYLARDIDALSPNEVKLVEFSSSADVMQHLRAGSLEAGALTLDEALSLLSESISLRVVLVLDTSDGADGLLSQPGIDSLEELAGKRVGVEMSGVGAFMLHEALTQGKLEQEQVTLVPLPADRHEKAFLSREVDAVVTFEPAKERLLAMGASSLFTSRDIPGRIVDVLVVREEALAEHRSQLQSLLKAYFKARNFMRQDIDTASGYIAPRLGIPAEELKNTFKEIEFVGVDENRAWLKPDGRLQEVAKRLGEIMLAADLIKEAPNVDALADHQFLEAF
ncbi:MAG: ABC transporter substrate-binding protein [bacterium]